MTRYLRLILFFIVFTVKCYASGDTASMLHFTIENGFPSNHVYSVIQDNAGYLWFATDNGIVKYNGYTFKIFNTASGLPSNDIYQLFVDHKGRIWIHAYTYKIGYIENDIYKDVLRSSKGIISPWSMADDKKKV